VVAICLFLVKDSHAKRRCNVQKFPILAGWILVGGALLVGCTGSAPQSNVTAPVGADPGPASAEGAKYLLTAAPEGAQSVVAGRESAAAESEIVLTGRIGGDVDPWFKGQAGFLIADASLVPCSEMEGDTCPTPWDYCCVPAEEISAGTALVKLVDEQGQPVAGDARELLGVAELQTVVVRGKAQVSPEGDLTVLATGVYVKE
jgi:hypothetical protein